MEGPDSGTGPEASGVAAADPSVDPARWLKLTAGIRGILEDSRGTLWFTSPDWACRFDPSARDSDDGGFTYFPPNSAGVVVGGFQEDSEGRIWAQGADGIHGYDGSQFTRAANRHYGSRHQWEKADGDLWFGADRAVELSEEEGQWGVYRLHDGECTFLAFPEAPAGERHHFYPLTSGAMRGTDGMLWFGTFNAAFGFDGQSFDIVGRERMGRAGDPRDIGIRGYHLDARGNLWIVRYLRGDRPRMARITLNRCVDLPEARRPRRACAMCGKRRWG